MTYNLEKIIERRNTDSVKWSYYGEDVLPLWVADMDFPAPEPLLEALQQRITHGILGYGTEPSELRPALVEHLKRLYGWEVRPKDFVFVPGIVSGFNIASRAVTRPGDGLLLQTPIYHPLLRVPRNAGLVMNAMELTQQPGGQYTIDWDRFEAAITGRTRIFVLCNPHNPVGRVYRRDELERMAEVCLRHDIVICSDEIHCDLVFEGAQHQPIAALAPEIAARTITLMAPSKTYNIAGIHASFAVIQDSALRRQFLAAQADLVPRLGIMGYLAMQAAYLEGAPWLEQVLRYLKANRDHLYRFANTHLPGVHMARPEGTYLAWLDCRHVGLPGNAHEFFLKRARVALNDGASFGPGGEGFVRLNFGCPRSTLDEALARMRDAILAVGR
jgi:cystathionine beta-lyase